MDLKRESSRLEQRTLVLSLLCVVVIALGSLAWGLAIESDVVILNGVFSLVSLIGSVLYLTAARLVARPADRRFQYGYAHVEPMVNSVNGMLVLVICLYAFINGIEGLRAGGSEVDASSVIWFGAVSGLICATVGTYELWMSRRTGSQLLRNDAREWLIDAAFSLVTLLGFAALFVLEDPLRSTWARYADSALVALLALLFLPIPLGVVWRNVRELLHMSSEDDAITRRVEAAMRGDSQRARHPQPYDACGQGRPLAPGRGQHRRRPAIRTADRGGAGRAAPTDLERRGPADRRGLAHHQLHRGSALGMSAANHRLCRASGIRQNGGAVRARLRLQRLAAILRTDGNPMASLDLVSAA